MAWRLLMRRCPSRSMTVVGDVAQTGDPAGAASWDAVFEPYVADRWRLAELTVNYRTPAEIMELARAGAGVGSTRPPRRRGRCGRPAWRRSSVRCSTSCADVVRARGGRGAGDGRVAVIVPAGRVADARPRRVPASTLGDEPDLESPVVVLTVRQAKGLEFDAVVVVDPDGIVAESPRGANDLYVALTRATQRLTVLHSGDSPPALLA